MSKLQQVKPEGYEGVMGKISMSQFKEAMRKLPRYHHFSRKAVEELYTHLRESNEFRAIPLDIEYLGLNYKEMSVNDALEVFKADNLHQLKHKTRVIKLIDDKTVLIKLSGVTNVS